MARFATDAEVEALGALRRQIQAHQRRNTLLTQYAEAERLQRALNLRLPDGKVIEQTPLHWPSKAIEVFHSRLVPAFYSIRDGEDVLDDLEDAWVDARVEFVESLAIEAALRHGPGFIFTGAGDPDKGEPDLVVTAASALRASARINPRTWQVTDALELLDDRTANLYLPGRVLHVAMRAGGRVVVESEYPTPGSRVMCAPYIHNATLDKPFGTSRITRSVRGFTDAAVRTFQRQEVSAAHYAQPRERLLGVSTDAFEDGAGWSSEIGDVDVLPDVHPDDDPNLPDELRRASVHYRPQATMVPFSDQFRLIASQFSGASSIPLQYLGIVQDSNPTSAPAIEAQDIDLVRAVKGTYPSFNMGRRMLALNILTLVNGGDLDPRAVRTLSPRWADPRVRSIREQSDFVKAQVEVGNFQAGTRATLDLLPITPEEAGAHAAANQRAAGRSRVLDVVERAMTRANGNATAGTEAATGAVIPEA